MAINRLNPDYPDAGMVQLIPASIAVGSGSGSTNGNGQVSFSGVSSVSLNGIFSSAYDNYKVILTNLASGSNIAIRLRLRINGTDATASEYNFVYAQTYVGLTYPSAGGNNADTKMYLANASSAARSLTEITIARPFIAQATIFNSLNSHNQGTTIDSFLVYGNNEATTSYDGFTIYPDSGTITGEVSVYGYRN